MTEFVNVVDNAIPENGETEAIEAVGAMSSEAVGPPSVALLPSVVSHPVRQMAPLSGAITNLLEATSNGGVGHTTSPSILAAASTEATIKAEDIIDAGASKLQQQKYKQEELQEHGAADKAVEEPPQQKAEKPQQKAVAASEKALTGTDSWLAVAENEAVGGDALKELEAAAAASMIPSGTNHQHPSYHPTKSVEEATPKLHHHHHHHHHYHHHQHTLRSQQQCQKLSIIIL